MLVSILDVYLPLCIFIVYFFLGTLDLRNEVEKTTITTFKIYGIKI